MFLDNISGLQPNRRHEVDRYDWGSPLKCFCDEAKDALFGASSKIATGCLIAYC